MKENRTGGREGAEGLATHQYYPVTEVRERRREENSHEEAARGCGVR